VIRNSWWAERFATPLPPGVPFPIFRPVLRPPIVNAIAHIRFPPRPKSAPTHVNTGGAPASIVGTTQARIYKKKMGADQWQDGVRHLYPQSTCQESASPCRDWSGIMQLKHHEKVLPTLSALLGARSECAASRRPELCSAKA